MTVILPLDPPHGSVHDHIIPTSLGQLEKWRLRRVGGCLDPLAPSRHGPKGVLARTSGLQLLQRGGDGEKGGMGPTSAPLLRRIMKTMKVSNQSCSTMRKQVFLMFHQIFPLSLVTSTWRQGNLLTQPEGGDRAWVTSSALCCVGISTLFGDVCSWEPPPWKQEDLELWIAPLQDAHSSHLR